MSKNQNTTNPYTGLRLSDAELAQVKRQLKKRQPDDERSGKEAVIASIAESEALYEQEEQFGEIEVLAANAPAGAEILSAGLDIIQLLLQKNISYGNSAIEPLRLFSKANNEEQIYVRVDDKLSRLKNNQSYPGDNDIDDLIGYLLLLKVARRKSEG